MGSFPDCFTEVPRGSLLAAFSATPITLELHTGYEQLCPGLVLLLVFCKVLTLSFCPMMNLERY